MTTQSSHPSATPAPAPAPAPGTPATPLSPTDQHKQVAQKEAQSQSADPKAVFLGDGIAYANLYTVPGSASHNDNNPGLLTRAWDPSNSGLPVDGGAIIYPDIDTGAKALHTFVGKILSNPPAPAPGTPAPAGQAAPKPGALPFTPDMTIQAFAQAYTPANADAWVKRFTDYTGVASDAKLSEAAA